MVEAGSGQFRVERHSKSITDLESLCLVGGRLAQCLSTQVGAEGEEGVRFLAEWAS